MNKQVVYKHNPKGQIIGLEEVHEFNSQNDILSIVLLAKKNKQADDDEKLEADLEEAKEKAERHFQTELRDNRVALPKLAVDDLLETL